MERETGEKQSSLEKTPLDVALRILADKFRRRLLIALVDHNPQDDNDTQIPANVTLDEEEIRDIQIAMAHTHLPKLEDYGFIEWDTDENVIRRGPQFEEIKPLLELIQNQADEFPDDWL